MPNLLQHATSPYLRQHADNPVHWQEWGPEAFAEAARRDVPVLISIGYAACHWCHVMAHESFADPAVAAVLNDGFVSIKVDREERPDVDAVYMSATVALTGHGGWPMTVFATPDGRPFYCGTYFPPTPRQGMPSFGQLLHGVRDAWSDRREQTVSAADQVAAHIRRRQLPATETAAASPADLERDLAAATERLESVFDPAHGGFGGAPKFPPATLLPALCATGATQRGMAATTLTRMAYGGIYDQLAGGFCRYSVDAEWVVPHFEKMLYDNALLLSAYAAWIPHDGTGLARRIAAETVEFLERDLRTEHGGYAASLDADTDGVEGLTYVWSPEQLDEVLGGDAPAAAALLRVTAAGTFEHGSSVLQLAVPDEAALPAQWPDWRARLLRARAARPQPARDDKVVTAWNALAVSGLCDVYRFTGEVAVREVATRVADALLDGALHDGRLSRASIHGTAGTAPGMLEDYAALAAALMRVHLATARRAYLDTALALIDTARELFADDEALYADAPVDSELIHRPADVLDNPTPAGIAALTDSLALAHAVTGKASYAAEVETLLGRLRPALVQAPNAAGTVWRVAQSWIAGMPTYVVAGPPGEQRDAFAAAARAVAAPGTLLLTGGDEGGSPLLTGRVGEAPRLFACRFGVCERPLESLADVRALAG